MLVICEDCAKKYNIDESKIRGNRARFTCNECGHIIIVEKSDLGRPLVRSAEHDQTTSSSTIDLLKEMETPLISDSDTPQGDSSELQEEATGADTEGNKSKKKILPIPAYFLIGGALTFFITNAGVMYILSQYYSLIAKHQQEFQFDMLIIAILVLVVVWSLSILILFGIGQYISKTVNKLTMTVNLVNMGDKEATVVEQGPKEIIELARNLSELCEKVR